MRAVDIVMPEVKLNVADLAYMTALLSGNVPYCAKGRVTDKLAFLGLIERGEIPPCPVKLAEYEARRAKGISAVLLAVREKRWDDIANVCSDINRYRPSATKDWVLTKSGREFMARGRAVSVTSAKGGCL